MYTVIRCNISANKILWRNPYVVLLKQ